MLAARAQKVTIERPGKLIDKYTELCRKSGAVRDVGPAHYAWFSEMSAAEMEEVLFLILKGHGRTVHQAEFPPQPRRDKGGVDGLLETSMSLIASGYMALRLDGQVACYAPEGPPPTEEEAGAIDRQIERSLTIFRASGSVTYPPGCQKVR